MIMPILRYFATKCKVLSRRGALLTLSDPASIKIHEAIKYKSISKGIEGKAMCTSIHTNFNKYIDLSEQTNLLEAGEEILIDKTNIYAPRTTGEIVGPCTSSSNGVSLAYTVKQRLREKSKQLPKQLFTKYIAIDLNQPIIEGEFAVMLGPSNRGKSKISQSSILSHIQKPNHYSIYCSASLENCKYLQSQSTFVKDKCTIIYSDLKKLESIASFFSSLKIAEAMSIEQKNTLLVFDDVVQQLVHERSHQVPSDMLSVSNVVQQAMQMTGHFKNYSLTSIIAVDEDIIPQNIYSNFLCSIECSSDKVYTFKEKNTEFKRPLPILSFSTKKETRKEYSKLLSILQEKLCQILAPAVEKGKYIQLKSYMTNEEKGSKYSYEDIKKMFPLIVHEVPYDVEIQVVLVSLYLDCIQRPEIIREIKSVELFKGQYLKFMHQRMVADGTPLIKLLQSSIENGSNVEDALGEVQKTNGYNIK